MKIPEILSLDLKLLEFRGKTLSLETTLSLNLHEFSEVKNKPVFTKPIHKIDKTKDWRPIRT